MAPFPWFGDVEKLCALDVLRVVGGISGDMHLWIFLRHTDERPTLFLTKLYSPDVSSSTSLISAAVACDRSFVFCSYSVSLS